MAFRGWPATALEFYEGLEADNSKSYWTAQRDVYERDVKAPMQALLEELSEEFGPAHLFRPNRDVRFSSDKSPYKTNIAATIGDGYVSLSADGLMAGAGYYMMAADQLSRHRAAVADDKSGPEIEGVVAVLRRSGLEIMSHGALKTAPRGYDKDHPRIELLRMKGLVCMRTWPAAAWLGTAAAKKKVTDTLRAAGPLLDWLSTHVGPSTLPPEGFGGR